MFLGIVLMAALAGQQASSIMNEVPPSREVFLWGQGLANGKHYVFASTEETVGKTPEWFPEKTDPPLAVSRAIAIAKKAALEDHPKFDDLIVSSVEVRRAGCVRSDNRWFYLVDFSPVIDGQSFSGSEITAAVLMDETVVRPQEKNAPW